MKQPLTIEFVSTKLKPGVDRGTFLGSILASQTLLQEAPGYLSRQLLHDAEHELWFDLVQWTDMEKAEAAAAAFSQAPSAAALIASLDEQSITMRHYEQRMELCAMSQVNPEDTPSTCVELLTYRLKPEADRERYEQVLRDMSAMMRTSPSFLRREVYWQPETGEWLEAIYYLDREAADAMFAAIKDADCMQECMALLDESSLSMHFAAPVSWE